MDLRRKNTTNGVQTHPDAGGDGEDIYRLGYKTIFASWTNPSSNSGSNYTGIAVMLKQLVGSTMYVDLYENYVPDAPQNLAITNAGQIGQSPNLSWNSSSGALTYNIYRCAGYYNPCNWQLIANTSNTTYTDYEVIITSQSEANDKYYYYVTAVTPRAESSGSNIVSTWGESFQKRAGEADITTGDAPFPERFILLANHPNPFNPETEIRYTLPKAGYVKLVILNLFGQTVRTLVAGEQSAGYYRQMWNGQDSHGNAVASGVYLYRLIVIPDDGSKRFSSVRKMLLAR